MTDAAPGSAGALAPATCELAAHRARPASRLARSAVDAFAVCAAELGMFSAARVFAGELCAEPDRKLVQTVVSALGEAYPVFDFVAARVFGEDASGALGSVRPTALLAPVDASPIAAALAGLSRLVVVGLEAHCLDALLPALDGVRVGLVPDLAQEADQDRIAANYEGSVELLDLAGFQKWAGRTAGLLTVVYGADGFRATVCQSWLRAHGPDVRGRFCTIAAWNVLGRRMEAYPRWLGDTDVHDFSPLLGPTGAEERRA